VARRPASRAAEPEQFRIPYVFGDLGRGEPGSRSDMDRSVWIITVIAIAMIFVLALYSGTRR
jgi:hypothetical protein